MPSPLVVALALAGLGVAFARLARFFSLDIAADRFAAMVVQLVEAGNIERAVKLCDAAPKSLAAIGCKALLIEARKGRLDAGTLGAAWLAQVLALRPKLRKFERAVRVAAGLALPCLVVTIVRGGHPLGWVLPLAAGAAVVAGELKARRMEVQILGAWELVMDALAVGVREEVMAEYRRGG